MLRVSAILLLSLLATFVSAIKFDLVASPSSTAFADRKCLSQYVSENTMVIVTVKVGEGYNQRVDLEVRHEAFNFVGKSNVIDRLTYVLLDSQSLDL
jgi:hypothetical protein